MEKISNIILICLFTICSAVVGKGQANQESPIGTFVKVTKQDGSEYIGKLVSQDEREVRLDSTSIGSVIIPRYLISTILGSSASRVEAIDIAQKQNRFSTRYFLTTNGFSNSEDGSYILFNIFGPDFQFALTDHVTAGILTTWIGSPIVGSIKASATLTDNVHGAVGLLAGSSGWLDLGLLFALPYGSVTYGNRMNNVTVSGGYGYVAVDGEGDGRTLLSLAGTAKMWGRLSLVFDSMVLPSISENRGTMAFVSPGIRWFASNTTAFQFGYPFYYFNDGGDTDSGMLPFPTFGIFVRM